MEGFAYVDLFSTKGIEYVLVILFLVLSVGFGHYLHRYWVRMPKKVRLNPSMWASEPEEVRCPHCQAVRSAPDSTPHARRPS